MSHLKDSFERVQVAALTLHNGSEDETSDNLNEAPISEVVPANQ